MTYQPVIPLGGYAGWRYLSQTLDAQKQIFAASSSIQRETTHFRENIAAVLDAETLVEDRQLLNVALTAHGLGEDINAKAFIRKVLDEGTINPDAFANKLSDKRYASLATSFGFDLGTPNTVLSTFAEPLTTKYIDKRFEQAVGETNNALRMALNVAPSIDDIVDTASTEDGDWYSVMGNTALRRVFEGAMGLPESFAAVDIDQQLTQFKERSESIFGTDKVADFQDPETQEKLIRLFLIRTDDGSSASLSPAAIALSLLG